VGAPATPGVSAPTVMIEQERAKNKKELDDFDNHTDQKLINEPLETSWS
jgi:hypothetical protein